MRPPADLLARPDTAGPGTLAAVLALGLAVFAVTAVAAVVAGTAWPLAPLALLALPAGRLAPRPWQPAPVALLAAAVGGVALAVSGPGEAVWLTVTTAVAGGAGLVWRAELSRSADRASLAEQRVRAVSVRDDLTGCVNRAGLLLLGEQVLHDVRRRGDSVHAVLLEVAGLDDVRRFHGTHAADEVVAGVADALRQGTRGTDVVARWTPDTFAVLGPGSGSVPAELERRVRVKVLDQPPVPPAQWPCRLTAGSGVLQPWDDGHLSDLLRAAEEDLSLRRALRAPSAPEPPRPSRP